MKYRSDSHVARRLVRGIAPVITLFALLAPLSTMAAEPPKVGETAPDFELKALDDSTVKLSALTKNGTVVLVVLRGFPGYQCPLCTKQVGDLIGKAKQFEAAKAQVVMVYPGDAEGLKPHAEEFIKNKNMPKSYRLVVDPDYQFLEKYGLRWNAPSETSYPSTFVIDRKRKVLFAKVSKSHGDRARTADIQKAMPK